jgi:hypothetical protein
VSFLRKKTIRGREYYYEVENTWENGHVRQKVLRYVGPVSPIRKRKKEAAEGGGEQQKSG